MSIAQRRVDFLIQNPYVKPFRQQFLTSKQNPFWWPVTRAANRDESCQICGDRVQTYYKGVDLGGTPSVLLWACEGCYQAVDFSAKEHGWIDPIAQERDAREAPRYLRGQP